MLDKKETLEVQHKFGVSLSQVKRDHAISHVLSALQAATSEFVFFGGTGLARTYLNEGRLSEDIDLYATSRTELCDELEFLPEWIEQEFPGTTWIVHPADTRDPQVALLSCDFGIQIQIQVVDIATRGWTSIPTELSRIEQRFSDVPITKLVVPTFDGFVAMKAIAWFQRRSPRDLYDLARISRLGPVTELARGTIEKVLGYSISSPMMKSSVRGDWKGQLAHQTRSLPSEEECLTAVLNWWRAQAIA